MDMSSDYLFLADMRSQQIARLMREPRPLAFADDMNRLERNAQ
jgi:hypothetical protein